MQGIGRKFDGIQIADIIDANKLFDNGSDDLVQSYTRLIINVISDLLKIINWLLPFAHRIGTHSKKSYLEHVPVLIK